MWNQTEANDSDLFLNDTGILVNEADLINHFLNKNYCLMILYIPVFFLALFANTLVIIVVIKYHYMRNVTNYFLVNLSVADLLVTLVCMPKAIWNAYTSLWNFGEITCKIAIYLQCVAVASSVFTITAMAIDRYLAITQPFGFSRWFNRKTTIIVIVVLWIASISFFTPLLYVAQVFKIDPLENSNLQSCLEIWEDPLLPRNIFGIVCYFIMFVVPGIIMICAYAMMGRTLCSVKPPFDKNEGNTCMHQNFRLVRERKRVAWILLLLALVFAFCWLPHNTINLLVDTHNIVAHETVNSVNQIQPYTLLLGHANSALNPVIYCLMSRNFRKSVKELIFRTRINFGSKLNNHRMQWPDSSGSSQRQPVQRLKLVPTVHAHRRLSRLQSSQKTTKTCAV